MHPNHKAISHKDKIISLWICTLNTKIFMAIRLKIMEIEVSHQQNQTVLSQIIEEQILKDKVLI